MKTNLLLTLVYLGLTCAAVAADPWADNIVNYTPGADVPSVFGSDPPVYFTNSSASLGEPTRATGSSATSPWSGPYLVDDIVSIGRGGSLTVSFDEPVTNDPNNPYGIDLLVFGNAFLLVDAAWPYPADAENSGVVAAENGLISISDDGINFVDVTDVFADGLYPTNGYADSVGHFPQVGSVLSDFTKPVNPSLDITGLTPAETYAAYNGSGGGAGVDIGAYGFSEISYVKISAAIDAEFIPEIDAFADVAAVPEPTSLLILLAALPFVAAKRN